MMNLRIGIVSLLLTVQLSGCAHFLDQQPTDTVMKPMAEPLPTGIRYRPDSRDTELAMAHSGHEREYRRENAVDIHKRLADYADQLAMALMDRAFTLQHTDKIAVASFVKYNQSLREPTVLGNRLAEALIKELQHYGLTVIDTKLSKQLTIRPNGDLALTRDSALLPESLNIDYILTGTLIERPNGVEVNARVIAVDTQAVAAASNLFIPGFVVANEHYYASGE